MRLRLASIVVTAVLLMLCATMPATAARDATSVEFSELAAAVGAQAPSDNDVFNDADARVSTRDTAWATFTYSGSTGTSEWILYRIDGQWTVVVGGPGVESITCARLKRLAVPLVITEDLRLGSEWFNCRTRVVAWIQSPTGNIGCQVADRYAGTTNVLCQVFRDRPQTVTLFTNGRMKVCKGLGCLSNGPIDTVTLRYGKSVIVGRFRCNSTKAGMRCFVRSTGHGFLISRSGITRI